ncbi:hypothetical protein [Bartonella sp. cb54]|uniref:hypothetical protein n=1 Tax=Bartonella sp. cb54 TaxID=3385560 RepID=UPI0039A72D15
MNFFSECAKRIHFKHIVIVYIVGSVLWGISWYGDKTNLSALKTFTMQNIQNIVDIHLEEEEALAEADIEQPLAKNEPILNLQSHVSLNSEAVFNGMASVTSGVTFKLVSSVAKSWHKHTIRNIHLYGVETCAPRQKAKLNDQEWPCGAVTTAWLVTKTLGQDLLCKQAIMRNGIHYAQCFVHGVDLAEAGLAEGMFIISKDSKTPAPIHYLRVEEIARKNKVGLWSSDFTEPLKWQRDNGSYNPFESL